MTCWDWLAIAILVDAFAGMVPGTTAPALARTYLLGNYPHQVTTKSGRWTIRRRWPHIVCYAPPWTPGRREVRHQDHLVTVDLEEAGVMLDWLDEHDHFLPVDREAE